MTLDRLLSTAEAWIDWRADAQEEVTGLWNGLPLPLSSIGGTANAITASVTPALTAGLVAGMSFFLKPTANNTGAVTLTISGDVSRNVVNTSGAALASGNLQSGWTYHIYFDGTNFVLLGQSATPRITDYQVFTSNGTWTKPTGAPANALVLIEGWGGGGGALSLAGYGGGGGGAYMRRIMRASELTATVAVTIGAGGLGGSPPTAGGNTTFGSYLTAYGGGMAPFGSGSFQAGGGGGGGTSEAGGNGTGIGGGAGGFQGGGAGGYESDGQDATTENGGGGGGGGDPVSGPTGPFHGGRGVYGAGGGGNGQVGSLGGVSLYGGNGGGYAANGQVPGGGGGGNGGNGARGELRVLTIG